VNPKLRVRDQLDVGWRNQTVTRTFCEQREWRLECTACPGDQGLGFPLLRWLGAIYGLEVKVKVKVKVKVNVKSGGYDDFEASAYLLVPEYGKSICDRELRFVS
jgi:hypothetical protein